jgi:hypothetical protein
MITDHQFVGLRQWGIDPPAHSPCQFRTGATTVLCGQPRSQHATQCTSALVIRGEHFPCDLVTPHDGWAHSSKAAEAIWQ